MTTYYIPRTFGEAQALLRTAPPGLLVLAGGTDLMVREGAAVRDRPVLDVTRVGELARVSLEGDTLVLGAGVTYARCLAEPAIRRAAPLLVEVAQRFASPPIRNVATLGGNVANASPAGDGVAALWALDAEVEAWTPDGAWHLNEAAFAPTGFPPPPEQPSGPPPSGPPQVKTLDAGSYEGNAFKSSGGVGSDPESGLLQYTLTFTKAGTYPFVCLIHPKMGGVVEVS